MNIRILGDFNPDQLYCAGSVTKFTTTYVVLAYLASRNFDLGVILDDDNFLDSIASNEEAKSFLNLFQSIIGSKFTLRDLCTYYSGLPYTFDPSELSVDKADAGQSFKHHQVLEEELFLKLCRENIKPIYPNRSHYHYSELAIIFMAYFIEKTFDVKMEDLYQQFLVKKSGVKRSHLSRTRPDDAYVQELSDKYDYAAVGVQDHGFFCYSNAFYTTLNELKIILEGILSDAIYQQHMIDEKKSRNATDTIVSAMSLELRIKGDDLVVGFEGLSFSGCNIWSFSRKLNQGYLMFTSDEEAAYDIIYSNFGYHEFDPVPDSTCQFSQYFVNHYPKVHEVREIPQEYQGNYQRVKINDIEIKDISVLDNYSLTIRDPEEVTYQLMYRENSGFHITNSEGVHDSRIGLCQAHSGHRFMFYNGSLYKQLKQDSGVASRQTPLTMSGN